MKLYIHIGTEKTGTTAIQNCLFENRTQLSKEGFAYLNSALINENHLLLSLLAAPHSLKTYEIRKRLNLLENKKLEKIIHTTIQKIRSEIKTAKNDTKLIVSSEHLSSRIDNLQQVERLKNIFITSGVKEFRIIIYLRRQDLLLPSYISTSLKVGNLQSFNVLSINDSWLYYDSLISLWSKTFGKDSILINIYDKTKFPNGNIYWHFLNQINCNYQTNFDITNQTPNKSLSGIKLAYLNILNQYRQDFSHNNFLIKNIVKKLELIPDNNFAPRDFKIGSINQKIIFDKYKSSNQTIAKTYFNRDQLFDYHIADFKFDAIPYISTKEIMLINLLIEELK